MNAPNRPPHQRKASKLLIRKPFLGIAATGAAVLFMTVTPTAAWAEPPEALPASAPEAAQKWQPAFDYDGDGCYPTPAVGPDGTAAEGLNNSGALDGNCHDQSDLDNTNSYVRSKCDSGWCAHMYALYFEKDQATPSADAVGHRHDLEHVVVWVNEETDSAEYVSPSKHGDYPTYGGSEVAWAGTHPKIVYHKEGGLTHSFRLAEDDEEPENDYGEWQYPALVGWNDFPDGVRDGLTEADFGSATLALKDGEFESDLEDAKPEGIPFDPDA